MEQRSMTPSFARSIVAFLLLIAAMAAPCLGQEPATVQTAPADDADRATDDEARAAEAAEPERPASTEEEPPRDQTWNERIVVTATRSAQEAGDIPLHVTTIDREQIEIAPEIGFRELFLRVPAINLATENSSMSAGPVDSGIAFRGMGGTAQSRSLVLLDGLPVNDPFGSYILWARIPTETVERVEVVPGAGGSWGNLALSGVVNMITLAASDRTLDTKLKLGNLGVRDATLYYSDLGEHWSGWIAGSSFDSDGYILLDPEFRAPIDDENRTEYQTFSGKLSRPWSEAVALHLGATLYDEDRNRGTPLSADASTEEALNATVDLAGDGGGSWQLRLFGRDVGLEELESLVNGDRTSEIPNAVLDAPADSWGASGVWFGSAGGDRGHSLTAGTDLLLTSVESTARHSPVAGSFTQQVFTEGEQQFAGLFAQDLYQPSPRVTLLLGARFDVLTTKDGNRVLTDLATGAATEMVVIDENTEHTFNPNAGIVFEASETTRLRSSVYTGFRAPTASELFVDTIGRNKNASNPRLEPERLVGAEAGFDYTPSRSLATRVTAYWSEGRDLVERILIGRGGPGGSVIEPCGFVQQGAACRERQNLGKVRARGVEIEQHWRLQPHWRLELFGTLLESEVMENPANPAFVGNTSQHVPEEAGTLSLAYENPRLHAVARASYVGDRWHDANNELLLEDRLLVDLSFSRPIGAHWTPFVGITNLFDEEYVIAEGTDGPELGAPLMYHAGVRFAWR
jgi:outer membrane receptor protein involved in Fe transport